MILETWDKICPAIVTAICTANNYKLLLIFICYVLSMLKTKVCCCMLWHLIYCILGMARYHNFGFGTIPECNTSVSILTILFLLIIIIIIQIHILIPFYQTVTKHLQGT